MTTWNTAELWLQFLLLKICVAACSHHAALHRPDNKYDFFEKWILLLFSCLALTLLFYLTLTTLIASFKQQQPAVFWEKKLQKPTLNYLLSTKQQTYSLHLFNVSGVVQGWWWQESKGAVVNKQSWTWQRRFSWSKVTDKQRMLSGRPNDLVEAGRRRRSFIL